MWTRFMDMHSGGGQKEQFSFLHIEAPEEEAQVIFYNRFGHSADRVSCTCCGSDYSVSESETLALSSAFDRGCAYDQRARDYVEQADEAKYAHAYQTLCDYMRRDDVAIIAADSISPQERIGSVPEQGYVWMG